MGYLITHTYEAYNNYLLNYEFTCILNKFFSESALFPTSSLLFSSLPLFLIFMKALVKIHKIHMSDKDPFWMNIEKLWRKICLVSSPVKRMRIHRKSKSHSYDFIFNHDERRASSHLIKLTECPFLFTLLQGQRFYHAKLVHR